VDAVLNYFCRRVANEDVRAIPAFDIDYGVVYCSEQATVRQDDR
jgi:hypothetical protein